MTITEFKEEYHPPVTEEEWAQEMLEQQRVVEQARLYESNPSEFARVQAKGMVDHLQEYVRGNETTFVRYFVIDNEHHRTIHENFWEEARERFPLIKIIQDKDEPRIQRIHFSEVGVGLLARTDFDMHGEKFGINYEAYELIDRPAEIVGKIATGLAMS
jgi:hypothetical protein